MTREQFIQLVSDEQEALTDLDNRYTAFSTSIQETVKQSKNLDVVLSEISEAFQKTGAMTGNQEKRWINQLKNIVGGGKFRRTKSWR